ncbi:DUF2200 domain-containing protein [Companilactobacillus mishanensis]|uniref:DUF2200 domain-containing protein n=1 Tax=Companilactobacillus mishanensis TaxID=2486008 RepID=UPI00129720FA|nr:DUF2200 domain-containing protein [Companilactobacillus mishanensis]MQS90095.1 DUF2200 domain-containing protein [Companilactobacillus mishanensis]
MATDRIFKMTFSSIYPMYIQKVEKKKHTITELNQVISWLTGYDDAAIQKQIDNNVTMEEFFNQAPHINDNANLITGVICGIRVEDMEDPLAQKIRYLDKLVDEVAKGKKMENILRKPK